MNKGQAIVQAITDAGGWLTTSEVADVVGAEKRHHVSAHLVHLRGRGLIESEVDPDLGSGEMRHRVKNAAAAAAFLADGEEPTEPVKNRLVSAVTPTPSAPPPKAGVKPPMPAPAAIAKAANGPAPVVPPKSVEAPARIGVAYAIDQRGKLILCFGDAAFELQPPQWKPLATFLHSLQALFA